MTAGIQSYLRRTASIKGQLPPDVLQRLSAIEAREDYDSPEYGQIMMEDLYPKVICRTAGIHAGQERVPGDWKSQGLGAVGSIARDRGQISQLLAFLHTV